jgi:hypothetical protein
MPAWGTSSIRNGWNWDAANTRLDFGYRGTRIGHLNASGMTLASDLFFGSGAKIDFNSADITITHAANSLTFSGGDFLVANGFGLVMGHTAQVNSVGQAGVSAEFQVLGTAVNDSAILLGMWNTTDTTAPSLTFLKSGDAAIAGNTIVGSAEILGNIFWGANDGVDNVSTAAGIAGIIDGTPGANDTPGRIVFYTCADGAQVMTEHWRITSVGVLTSLAAHAANAANTTGGIIATAGIAFTDVANAWIDDASRGSGTVAHYIGNQAITTSSDMRIKRDITDWNGDALALLRQGRLVEYAWDDPTETMDDGNENPWGRNSRGKFVGFLAQEVVSWAPWAINAGEGRDCPLCNVGEPCEDHPYWFADYDHMVPLVVGGMQQLDTRVTRLEDTEWLKDQVKVSLESADFKDWLKAELAV